MSGEAVIFTTSTSVRSRAASPAAQKIANMVEGASGNKTSSAGSESPLGVQNPNAFREGLERQLRQIEENADRAAEDWSALMKRRAQEDEAFRAIRREEEDRRGRRALQGEQLQLRWQYEDLSLQEARLQENEEKLKAYGQAEEQLKRRRRMEYSALYKIEVLASQKETEIRRHLRRLKRTLPAVDAEVLSPLLKNNKHLRT